LRSLLELESQLLFARELNVLTEQHHARLNERSAVLRKMLIALMQRVLATITDDAAKRERGLSRNSYSSINPNSQRCSNHPKRS